MGQCHLRQNERDVREYAKYDGTLEALKAVQRILPRQWSSWYTITEAGVSEFTIARQEQKIRLGNGSEVAFLVVDRFGELELHDSSSFYFLFSDAGDERPVWGG